MIASCPAHKILTELYNVLFEMEYPDLEISMMLSLLQDLSGETDNTYLALSDTTASLLKYRGIDLTISTAVII
jgi:hypothetical protein